MELTKSEMEVMEVLWASPVPMGVADLKAAPHTWSDKSVHIVVNGLLAKGAIKLGTFERRGKTFARLWVHAISRQDYWAQLIYSHHPAPDPISMVVAVLKAANVHGGSDLEHVLNTARGLYEDVSGVPVPSKEVPK